MRNTLRLEGILQSTWLSDDEGAAGARTGRQPYSWQTILLRSAVTRLSMKKGLAIPEDISVVGYNDIPAAKYLVPPLPRSISIWILWESRRCQSLAERF